ncbi:MAG: hypothetical protein Q8J97_02385, partial [Flavobacteriaceae bacterium]|nr:hypothetical protein [Flavobacteriaceae bacterium]
DEFLGALFFNARTLLIVAVFGAVALVVAVPIVLFRRHRRRVDKKLQEEAAARRRLQKMLSPGGGSGGKANGAAASGSPARSASRWSSDTDEDDKRADQHHQHDDDNDARRHDAADDDLEREAELAWIDAKIAAFAAEFPQSPMPLQFARSTRSSVLGLSQQLGLSATDVGVSFAEVELEDEDASSDSDEGQQEPEAPKEAEAAAPRLQQPMSPRKSLNASQRSQRSSRRELSRPDALDPRTWGIFLCGPESEKRDRLAHLSAWLRRRYDVLERSFDVKHHDSEATIAKNHQLRVIEKAAHREFCLLADIRSGNSFQWILPPTALETFEAALAALEVHRVCQTEDERARYTAAMEELSKLRDTAVAEGREPLNGVPLLVGALYVSGVQQPSESSANRQLLLSLDEFLSSDAFRRKVALKQLVRSGALIAGSVAALRADGLLSAGGSSGTTPAANGAPASADTSDSPNLLQRFADGASRNYVGSRANIVFSQWQLVGLLFAGVMWPSLYVQVMGPIGSIASLKLDMSFSVHFEVSYYITT